MDAHDLLSAALNQSGINSEDVATNDVSRHHAASRYVHGFTQPSLHNFFGGPYSFPSGSSQSYFPGKMPTDQGYFPDKMSHSQGYFPGKMPVCDMPALNHHILASMLGNSHNPFPPNFMQHPAMIPNFTSKDLSKFWLNEGIKHNPFVKPEAETEEAEEEEELVHAETYNEYVPTKLKIGQRHPDPVVETSSLSSISPPDVTYKVSLDEEIIDRGLLSALQLEAIVYACQQHETFLPDGSRAGFLIGDGAGVGKGRTLAGIIYENYMLGRKRAIWLSVSNDLKYDSERDLQDIGAGKIEVYPLNKFKYAKISSKVNGSVKKGVIFATYSSLIGESQSGGKYKTRLKQLLNWCGEDFDGVIVFDECHKAKNLCPVGSSKPTKTGLTVLELQNSLPKARVVYASATGASEPKNMAYMTRLGIWGEGTTFNDFSDFISAVEKRGVGAMELVAMEMKQRGMYIARQLSFAGVSFKIEEIPLTQDFIEVYDRSVKLWVDAREKFQKSAELLEGDQRIKKSMWSQFWGSHQRFFKYLCIASKVKPAVALAREAVKNGKCIVIGLQSTGEARTLEQLEEAGGELTDFVSTAKGVLQTLIDKHFPAPDRKKMSRLLGLESFMKEEVKEIKQPISPVASSSCGGTKRKSARQARQLVKRYRESKLTDESNSEAELEENDDSEFAPSDSNSSDREPSPSPTESEDDSDFNPFGEESDSDGGPWLGRKKSRKKKTKQTKTKKKHKSKSQINGNSPPPVPPPVDAVEKAQAMKEELLKELNTFGDHLPPNTLDQLIDELGGPENVAEMTGRKGRVVSNDDGSIQYESRSEIDVPVETLNITEKQRFMDGEKHIAIISEAASSGISLQADRRAKNQARRVHITLELPWSADRAIQQFGRTHRSNQVSAPEYLFLISDLAGERRFASIVAKRLESLGALTHGDRRATESRDLSKFNIDTKYGRVALESMMRAIMQMEIPQVPPPEDYEGDFFADVRKALVGVGLATEDPYLGYQNLEKDAYNMSKFLNRILGMEVKLQNKVFKYFTDTLDEVISQAKKTGRYDLGIMDMGTTGDEVCRIKCNVFIRKNATVLTRTELHTVAVERGMSWEAASNLCNELEGDDEGFYISRQARNDHYTAILAVCDSAKRLKDKREKKVTFRVYRPNTGLQAKQETLSELKSKYKRVLPDDAKPHWEDNYKGSENLCSHQFWYGSCRRKTMGLTCDIGLRRRTYYVLSGSVLAVWPKVESVLLSVQGSHNSKLQVVRLRTQDGQRIVGSIIPPACVAPLINILSEDSIKAYCDKY